MVHPRRHRERSRTLRAGVGDFKPALRQGTEVAGRVLFAAEELDQSKGRLQEGRHRQPAQLGAVEPDGRHQPADGRLFRSR